MIERTLGFRDYVGDYQRQLFLVDHAGLPLKTVLEQIDLLGTEVVPVLRRELDALRPAHVPDGPTHAVAPRGAARRGRGRQPPTPAAAPAPVPRSTAGPATRAEDANVPAAALSDENGPALR